MAGLGLHILLASSLRQWYLVLQQSEDVLKVFFEVELGGVESNA